MSKTSKHQNKVREFLVYAWGEVMNGVESAVKLTRYIIDTLLSILTPLVEFLRTILWGAAAFIAAVALFVFAVGAGTSMVMNSMGLKDSAPFATARDFWVTSHSLLVEKTLKTEFATQQASLDENQRFTGELPVVLDTSAENTEKLQTLVDYIVENKEMLEEYEHEHASWVLKKARRYHQ